MTVHYCTIHVLIPIAFATNVRPALEFRQEFYLRPVFFVVVDKGDIRVVLYNVINRYGRFCISIGGPRKRNVVNRFSKRVVHLEWYSRL